MPPLSRIGSVLLGHVVGIAAAGLWFIFYEFVMRSFGLYGPGFGLDEMDVSSIMIGAVIVVAMYGSLPALVAIWYAEDTSTRSLRYYVVAATAVAALLAFWLFAARMMFERYLPLLHILIAGPAAGAVWGVVYWGMAGRSAGEWKEHLAA